ncbi:MAG: hypothetical protein JJT93_12780 [Gammaproteobacteria bacterium]|nr:hypothetical protein [Gammaproteobacteria bacterium]TVQ50520.1 MAG: hypothetical protein EA371_00225 [Gammaproteobacteria bacterium]
MTRIVAATAVATVAGLVFLMFAVPQGASAQASDEERAPPPARTETDERDADAAVESPPPAASGDQFTPTERLRHDQEVDFPVDI